MIGLEIIVLFFIFILISILGNLSGTGGGLLRVPILIFFGYVTISVPISLLIILFLSIPTTIINIKRELIHYKIALFIIIGSFSGTIIGKTIYDYLIAINLIYYIIIFTIFLLIASFRFYLTKDLSEKELEEEKSLELNIKNLIILISIGFGAGISSSLFGIGGGLIVTPLLVILYDFRLHRSIATSVFIMNFTAIFGIFQFFINGYYSTEILLAILILGIATISGSIIASYLLKKAKHKSLKYIFLIIVLALAIPLLWLGYFFPDIFG
ncbi:MAG: membrane protein of unknown function [Promethearchaeota archaeon]|nr:MAG: membrane protein of unknown function [Candidatus Lokiarchaeota archaeon]